MPAGEVSIAWHPAPPPPGPTVVAIGTFDGVHLGHQVAMREASDLARELAASCVAVTFDPHPRHVLAPEGAPRLLTPLQRRVRLLQELGGARAVAVIRFERHLASLDPETFARHVVVERMMARGIVAGFNFTFGRDRQGTATTLQALGARLGLAVRIVAPVEIRGKPVSSSAIRRLLDEGDVRAASELLGRPFDVEGTVVMGRGLGRQMGYPTANVEPAPLQQLPSDAVYLALLDRAPALGVVSTRPTLGGGERVLEVHVLEGRWALYGRQVVVAFLERLRPIIRFDRLEDLVRQIEADRLDALQYFGRAGARRSIASGERERMVE